VDHHIDYCKNLGLHKIIPVESRLFSLSLKVFSNNLSIRFISILIDHIKMDPNNPMHSYSNDDDLIVVPLQTGNGELNVFFSTVLLQLIFFFCVFSGNFHNVDQQSQMSRDRASPNVNRSRSGSSVSRSRSGSGANGSQYSSPQQQSVTPQHQTHLTSPPQAKKTQAYQSSSSNYFMRTLDNFHHRNDAFANSSEV
jgi:hypothetical protein